MALRTHDRSTRARIALATAVALLTQPLTPVIAQTAAPATQGAAQKPTLASATAASAKPAAATTQAPLEKAWPRAFQIPSGMRVLLYAPQVIVSTTTAEVILLAGAPNYVLVTVTSKLLWVSNTESDVFRMGKAGTVCDLVSGRWFSASDFKGPWTFATPNLPEDFQKIGLQHERSRVLASVPGTQQAAEGVLLAQVPQTARVNKKEIKAPEVKYQGDPTFEPIERTTVARAVNTDKDIIKLGDLYDLCFQGVWFMLKSPDGPWEVCESVPKEICEIPAGSPAHNVTYVAVVEDDDDDWVTCAAVAGYTGLMIAWGCAVWGTGWYYPLAPPTTAPAPRRA